MILTNYSLLTAKLYIFELIILLTFNPHRFLALR